jgi:hypothetical protein
MIIYLIVSISIIASLIIGGVGMYCQADSSKKIVVCSIENKSDFSAFSPELQHKIEQVAKLKKAYEDFKNLNIDTSFSYSIDDKMKNECSYYEDRLTRQIGEEQLKIMQKGR